MVGVKSANKCNTCRKKKIKCDEQKPTCGQCRKGSRVCEGYRGPATFLNKTSTDYSPSKIPSSRDGRVKSRGRVPIHSTNNNLKFHPDRVVQLIPSCTPSPPPSQPLRFQSWSHDQLLAEFLDNCLPPSQASQDAPLAWLRTLLPMHKEIDALPLAISALAFGWAGHVNGYPQLVDKGLQLYNAAVHQLRTEMSAQYPLQVLATTAIFTLYELYEFGSETSPGWLCHAAGIAATLRSLGPEMVSLHPYKEIFSFCRIIFMTRGLKHRRLVCAGAPMWKEIPYQHSGKSSFQKLLDLGLDMGEILGHVSALDNTPNPRPLQAQEVLQRVLSHVSKLKAWEVQNKLGLLEAPFETPMEATPEDMAERCKLRGYPSKPNGRTKSEFDKVQAARGIHFYWTLLLKLYMGVLESPAMLAELSNVTRIPDYEGVPLTATAMEQEASNLADRVALYSNFCCQNLYRSYGPMVSIFSLETVIAWYERHPEPFYIGEKNKNHSHEQSCRELLSVINITAGHDTQLAEEYQQATFGNVDLLSLPWC